MTDLIDATDTTLHESSVAVAAPQTAAEVPAPAEPTPAKVSPLRGRRKPAVPQDDPAYAIGAGLVHYSYRGECRAAMVTQRYKGPNDNGGVALIYFMAAPVYVRFTTPGIHDGEFHSHDACPY